MQSVTPLIISDIHDSVSENLTEDFWLLSNRFLLTRTFINIGPYSLYQYWSIGQDRKKQVSLCACCVVDYEEIVLYPLGYLSSLQGLR